MASRQKYSDEERERALELCRQHGPREASRQTGIPFGTIGNWARQAGISREHARTQAATEARQVANAARRATLAANLLKDAERLRQQLFAPCTAFHFGGKDNTYEEHEISEPDFKGKQALLTSIGIAIDKSLAIEKHDAEGDQGMAAVDAWLKAVTGK